MISASASNDQFCGSQPVLKTKQQNRKKKYVWVLILFDEIFVSAISVCPCLYIQIPISLYFRVYVIIYLVAMEKVTKLFFSFFQLCVFELSPWTADPTFSLDNFI